VVVDWGDGQVAERQYPCSTGGVPSDRTCALITPLSGGIPVYGPPPGDAPLPAGPWNFSFSHTYAYGADNRFTNPAHLKVYAVTTLSGRSQTERIDVSITNVPPTFEAAPLCPLVQFPVGGIFLPCVSGDFREVAAGQPLTIRGRIFDTPAASHFVKVKWGDGTSSAYLAGCTDPGCPGYASAWVGATTPSDSVPPKYLSVAHTYETVGSYNITLEVDDGGPNGHLSYSTQAVIIGVSDLAGPTEARAGTPATYTYTSRFPAGATPVLTPTCETGTVTGSTSSSFTCSFPDVVSSTASHAKLHAVVPINPSQSLTFDRTLDILILPRLTTISPFSGPTIVTERTTATYTYSETYAPGGIVFEAPSCGPHGHVTFSQSGSSITCQFDEVSTAVTSDVSISVSALGGTASSTLSVSVVPDATPPVLTLPDTIRMSSTSNAGAIACSSAECSPSLRSCRCQSTRRRRHPVRPAHPGSACGARRAAVPLRPLCR